MITQEDLIGTYYVFTKRTRVESREYTLRISKAECDILLIALELAISGRFGSVGKDWNGFGTVKEDRLEFKCTEHVDWRYTFLDDERQDMISHRDDIYSAEIIKEGFDIILNLNLEVDRIILCKAKKQVSRMTYWISRNLISHYKLDEQAEEVKPDFWMISNLVLKSYKNILYEGKDIIEVIVEYDLDLVKEEKRVIDGDEIVREHHIDQAILDINNGYRILKYEYDI